MSLFSRALANVVDKDLHGVDRVPMVATNSLMGIGSPGQMTSVQQLTKMPTSSWLFTCVDLIATKVASVDWKLFEMRGGGEKEQVEIDGPMRCGQGMGGQALLHLWNKVNPFYTRPDFLETSFQHYE